MLCNGLFPVGGQCAIQQRKFYIDADLHLRCLHCEQYLRVLHRFPNSSISMKLSAMVRYGNSIVFQLCTQHNFRIVLSPTIRVANKHLLMFVMIGFLPKQHIGLFLLGLLLPMQFCSFCTSLQTLPCIGQVQLAKIHNAQQTSQSALYHTAQMHIAS